MTFEERAELLTLAADAGGIKGLSISKGGAVHADLGCRLLSRWNPLEGLAEALDLAIRGKVQLDIRTIIVTCEPMGVTPGHSVVEPCDDNHESRTKATCLAIVRCMADIQRRRLELRDPEEKQ